ncbi:MAG: MFS transporter [Lachnospiraceae bacterium]|nr:MFS transporter [Lachnospiraceae bacterium]
MTRKRTLTFAILSIALVCQINTIASVMLADISKAFPSASNVAIQYVMQSGMIGAFVISFLMSVFTAHFNRKPMILMGLGAIFLGGLLPLVYHGSIWFLDVCGFITGAGQGFLMPLLGALILENYEGPERERMLGLNTTFITGGSALFLVLAGPICESGWTHVYFLYFAALPVMVIAQMFLAKEGKKEKAAEAEEKKDSAKIPVKGWIQCALVVLMGIGYTAFPLNLSFLVEAKGLGSATTVGIGMTMITVISALIGLVFPQIIRVSRLYISTVAAVFGLAATLIIINAGSMGIVYLGTALAGIYFGINTASPGYYIGRICSQKQYGPTFSMAMSCNFMGIILSPIILNWITGMWGGDTRIPVNSFITGSGVFALVLVLQILWNTYLKKTLPAEA